MTELQNFIQDLRKYYLLELGTVSPSLFKKLKLFIGNYGLFCCFTHRLGATINKIPNYNFPLKIFLKLVFEILNFISRFFHHVYINNATIGPGFYIGHVGNIFIGSIEVGDNFNITHNVTIGVGRNAAGRGLPKKIGDNVWVGTGSVISGSITIGNNVTIAAGTILSRDVPDGCLVAGNPGRIIQQNYDNSDLLGTELSNDIISGSSD